MAVLSINTVSTFEDLFDYVLAPYNDYPMRAGLTLEFSAKEVNPPGANPYVDPPRARFSLIFERDERGFKVELKRVETRSAVRGQVDVSLGKFDSITVPGTKNNLVALFKRAIPGFYLQTVRRLFYRQISHTKIEFARQESKLQRRSFLEWLFCSRIDAEMLDCVNPVIKKALTREPGGRRPASVSLRFRVWGKKSEQIDAEIHFVNGGFLLAVDSHSSFEPRRRWCKSAQSVQFHLADVLQRHYGNKIDGMQIDLFWTDPITTAR